MGPGMSNDFGDNEYADDRGWDDDRGDTAYSGGAAPPNHMVKAILVTVFCCLPFGIVSIVNAAQVNGAAQAGNMQLARSYSEQADKWANYGMIGWAVAIGLYIVMAVVMGGLGAVAGQ